MGSVAREGRMMQSLSSQGLLRHYLAPQRRGIVGLVILLVGGIALELAGPQIVRVFIDDAVAGEALGLLLILGGVFLVTALLRQGAAIAETFLAETISWTATNQVRADLTRHCLALDRAFHQTHTPGELIERIDGDVTKLANFFARLLIQTEDIRAFGAAQHVLRQLAQRTRHLLRRQRRAGIVGSATFNTLLLLLAISTAGSLGLGGHDGGAGVKAKLLTGQRPFSACYTIIVIDCDGRLPHEPSFYPRFAI
jgi:ABC-type multidrug transport system fused ATPase/permease subunit